MPYYRFSKDDIFYNQIETYPKSVFFIYSGSIFYNNMPTRRGTHEIVGETIIKNSDVPNVPTGFTSLYEMNVDRNRLRHTWDYALSPAENEAAGNIKAIIHPFATKAGGLSTFKTMTSGDLNKLSYGDTLTGSFAYPLSASIQREYYSLDPSVHVEGDSDSVRKQPLNTRIPVHDKPELLNNRFVNHQENHSNRPNKPAVMTTVPVIYSHLDALRNVLDSYTYLSPHYAYEFGDYGITKSTQELNLISIPSIFYGSSIRKGSVDLKFYVSGTLIAQCIDKKKNGELIEVTGSRTGSVAGVILYNEGFILLTGSWDLTNRNDTNTTDPKSPVIPGTNESAYPRSPHTELYEPHRIDTAEPAVGTPSTFNLTAPKWTYFGTGIERSGSGPNRIDAAGNYQTGYGTMATGSLPTFHLPSSSFSLEFEGVNRVPVMTMLAHAPIGELNHSNNPTFIKAHGGFMNRGRARIMIDIIEGALKDPGTVDIWATLLNGKTITFADAAGNTYSATLDSSKSPHYSTATKIYTKGIAGYYRLIQLAEFTHSLALSIVQAIKYGVTSEVKDTPDGSALLRMKIEPTAETLETTHIHTREPRIDLTQLDTGASGDTTPGGTLKAATRTVNGRTWNFIDFKKAGSARDGINLQDASFTGGAAIPIKSSGSLWPVESGSTSYIQGKEYPIKNTVSSSYANHTASFKKQTFISKIGIYDKERNLIGIAKLANPVKKTEERDFTFKLKLDF